MVRWNDDVLCGFVEGWLGASDCVVGQGLFGEWFCAEGRVEGVTVQTDDPVTAFDDIAGLANDALDLAMFGVSCLVEHHGVAGVKGRVWVGLGAPVPAADGDGGVGEQGGHH